MSRLFLLRLLAGLLLGTAVAHPQTPPPPPASPEAAPDQAPTPPATDVATLITQAIRERRLLQFRYDEHTRTAEPHLLGRTSAGHLAVCAWQTAGGSKSGAGPGWRVFRLDGVAGLALAETTFTTTRPGYRTQDKRFAEVIARVE